TNGEISIVREQTNGANGLAVTGEGDLLAAEGDGKRISKRSRDGTVTTVTEGSEGKPFLAPNDLILDAKGGIYFTASSRRRCCSASPLRCMPRSFSRANVRRRAATRRR